VIRLFRNRSSRFFILVIISSVIIGIGGCANNSSQPESRKTPYETAIETSQPMATVLPTITTYKTPEPTNNEYTFEKTYGDEYIQTYTSGTYGESVQQTSEGGYIVAGHKYNGPQDIAGQDMLLLKVDPNGEEIWNHTYGNDQPCVAKCVGQTSDGGYIMAGSIGTDDFKLTMKVYLVKTDKNGREIWAKAYGAGAKAFSIQQTTDGGYIAVGYARKSVDQSDVFVLYIVKTDPNGNELWNRTIENGYGFFGSSIQQTDDGGYIITGYTSSPWKLFLMKIDKDGNQKWDQVFTGKGWASGYSVRETSDKGYIIFGTTNENLSSDLVAYLVKTDENGTQQWDYTFGSGPAIQGNSVCQTKDGGFAITGHIFSGNGYLYLVKIDKNGNEIWNRTFGSGYNNWGSSVQETSDGGLIVTGTAVSGNENNANFRIYLLKTDNQGIVR
jgi:hypothetical protein